jgi:hypothetical protein
VSIRQVLGNVDGFAWYCSTRRPFGKSAVLALLSNKRASRARMQLLRAGALFICRFLCRIVPVRRKQLLDRLSKAKKTL